MGVSELMMFCWTSWRQFFESDVVGVSSLVM